MGTPTQVAWTKWLTKPQTDLFDAHVRRARVLRDARSGERRHLVADQERDRGRRLGRERRRLRGGARGCARHLLHALGPGDSARPVARARVGLHRPVHRLEQAQHGQHQQRRRAEDIEDRRPCGHRGDAQDRRRRGHDQGRQGHSWPPALRRHANGAEEGRVLRQARGLQVSNAYEPATAGDWQDDLPRLRRFEEGAGRELPGPLAEGLLRAPNAPPAGPGDSGGSCPTTPTARPAARRECPAPSPGIAIYNEDDVRVANFTIGSCTQGSGGFTAIAEDGAWHLEVGISNFTGNGDYEIPYGGPDPEVVIDGPPGTFSNETWMPGGLPFAGAIHFERSAPHGPRVHRVPDRRRIGGDQGCRRDDLRLSRRRVAPRSRHGCGTGRRPLSRNRAAWE